MEVIHIPESYAGSEVSLNQLIDWFNNVMFEDDDLMLSEEGITNDILDVLTVYKQETNSSWSGGTYYLFGQIPTNPDDPITCERLQKSVDATNMRYKDYGVPYNSFEAASIEQSYRHFSNLQRLLQFYYYDYPDEICYRPGRKGYIATMAAYMIRNPPPPPHSL